MLLLAQPMNNIKGVVKGIPVKNLVFYFLPDNVGKITFYDYKNTKLAYFNQTANCTGTNITVKNCPIYKDLKIVVNILDYGNSGVSGNKSGCILYCKTLSNKMPTWVSGANRPNVVTSDKSFRPSSWKANTWYQWILKFHVT